MCFSRPAITSTDVIFTLESVTLYLLSGLARPVPQEKSQEATYARIER